MHWISRIITTGHGVDFRFMVDIIWSYSYDEIEKSRF